ncbi:histidine phosphatase family protein [Ornithinimicrobium faecis]|uniref:histidine phosphatase family protein n=1 Tax=Ornithinimicrobium faecis TaxID=2934158 RepID=UPI0021186BC7|nr:histidine phosphatase family protein [Ornithinimicrobium sp. HY1745]
MSRVLILRHAMPHLDRSVLPQDWALSSEGRAAAESLRGQLPPEAHRWASAERKAQETLQLALPGSFKIDSRFNEVQRPNEAMEADVKPRRRAWVAGLLDERHKNWEGPATAAARFDAAVRGAPDGDLVVATHGMVLTAWLCSIGHLASGEQAAQFWGNLSFPSVIEVARQ